MEPTRVASNNTFGTASDYYALVFTRKHQTEVNEFAKNVTSKLVPVFEPLTEYLAIQINKSSPLFDESFGAARTRGYDAKIDSFKGVDGTRFVSRKFTVSPGMEEKEL